MEQRQGLRRELRFIEAIALSLAIMAPTAAMALRGTAVAGFGLDEDGITRFSESSSLLGDLSND